MVAGLKSESPAGLSRNSHRKNDAAVAETAVRQIETAYETLWSGGHEQWSAYFEAQLAKAQAIRDRLAPVAKP
jgi:hypothetical protein